MADAASSTNLSTEAALTLAVRDALLGCLQTKPYYGASWTSLAQALATVEQARRHQAHLDARERRQSARSPSRSVSRSVSSSASRSVAAARGQSAAVRLPATSVVTRVWRLESRQSASGGGGAPARPSSSSGRRSVSVAYSARVGSWALSDASSRERPLLVRLSERAVVELDAAEVALAAAGERLAQFVSVLMSHGDPVVEERAATAAFLGLARRELVHYYRGIHPLTRPRTHLCRADPSLMDVASLRPRFRAAVLPASASQLMWYASEAVIRWTAPSLPWLSEFIALREKVMTRRLQRLLRAQLRLRRERLQARIVLVATVSRLARVWRSRYLAGRALRLQEVQEEDLSPDEDGRWEAEAQAQAQATAAEAAAVAERQAQAELGRRHRAARVAQRYTRGRQAEARDQAATRMQSKARQGMARKLAERHRQREQERLELARARWRQVRDYAYQMVGDARDVRTCARDLNAAIRLLSRGQTVVKFGRQGIPHERFVRAVSEPGAPSPSPIPDIGSQYVDGFSHMGAGLKLQQTIQLLPLVTRLQWSAPGGGGAATGDGAVSGGGLVTGKPMAILGKGVAKGTAKDVPLESVSAVDAGIKTPQLKKWLGGQKRFGGVTPEPECCFSLHMRTVAAAPTAPSGARFGGGGERESLNLMAPSKKVRNEWLFALQLVLGFRALTSEQIGMPPRDALMALRRSLKTRGPGGGAAAAAPTGSRRSAASIAPSHMASRSRLISFHDEAGGARMAQSSAAAMSSRTRLLSVADSAAGGAEAALVVQRKRQQTVSWGPTLVTSGANM